MYVVVGFFDAETEQIIKDIWTELREKSISFYADQVVNRKPHITLASYHSLDKQRFIEQLDDFYENKPEIDISFNSIGSFLNTGILYFSPHTTKNLIEFHENFQIQFKHFNDNPKSIYLPEKWVPNCTIANRLLPDKLIEAYNYCLYRKDLIEGKIQEIGIIEMISKNNAPIIYSKYLKSLG